MDNFQKILTNLYQKINSTTYIKEEDGQTHIFTIIDNFILNDPEELKVKLNCEVQEMLNNQSEKFFRFYLIDYLKYHL